MKISSQFDHYFYRTRLRVPAYTLILFVILFIAPHLDASTHSNSSAPPSEKQCDIKPIVGARISDFHPFSKTLRQMVHNGGINYALETNVPLWQRVNMWVGVDFFSRKGKMVGIDRQVHITLVPITLGLKYLYPYNSVCNIYLGLAPKYYFVEMIDRSFPVNRTTHRHGLGGVIEAGSLFCVHNHFVIDIFISLSFKRVNGPSHLPPNATSSPLQVGGRNVGGGLGYMF